MIRTAGIDLILIANDYQNYSKQVDNNLLHHIQWDMATKVFLALV
jgi:hypothetical protein